MLVHKQEVAYVHTPSAVCMLLMPSFTFHCAPFLAGVIALLDEHDDDLKVYALQKLNGIVDQFWAEISDAVSKM